MSADAEKEDALRIVATLQPIPPTVHRAKRKKRTRKTRQLYDTCVRQLVECERDLNDERAEALDSLHVANAVVEEKNALVALLERRLDDKDAVIAELTRRVESAEEDLQGAYEEVGNTLAALTKRAQVIQDECDGRVEQATLKRDAADNSVLEEALQVLTECRNQLAVCRD